MKKGREMLYLFTKEEYEAKLERFLMQLTLLE